MNVDTDALRWFQQVAEGTTVTEVSGLGAVTQSGVSRALRRLEAQLGTPLLRRSGRTLRLTHAGAVFKRHADALLHQLDDGIAAVSQLIEPETGTVALAFQQSLGTWLVPDLVRTFRAAHPGVRFQLTQVRDELHSAALDGGQLRDLHDAAKGIGLATLVEVHTAAELERAVALGAPVIGVNNRNLQTLETSLAPSLALLPRIPRAHTAVSESGIFTRIDVESVVQAGARAVLVGEGLVRAQDVPAKVRELALLA